MTRLLTLLTSVWDKEIIDDPKIDAYYLALMDLDYDVGQMAVVQCFRAAEYFPKPATIREFAIAGLPAALPAGDAWDECIRFAGRVGHQGSPEFSSLAIADAVRAVGWKRICLEDDERAKKFLRRDFDAAYANAIERNRGITKRGELPAPRFLLGLGE